MRDEKTREVILPAGQEAPVPVLLGPDFTGTVVRGDLTIQGNIKGPASIIEPLQLAIETEAVRALVPVFNKTEFAGLPEEVVERLDVVLYGDLDRAVFKTLEA